jgi:hypothetical protein
MIENKDLAAMRALMKGTGGGAEYANREPDISVTLTEETQPIVFTEVNGKSLDAHKVAVLLELPAGTGNLYNHKIYNTSKKVDTQIVSNCNYSDLNGIDTKESRFFLVAEKINDKCYKSSCWYICKNAGVVEGMAATVTNTISPNNIDGETSMKRLELCRYNTLTFGVGTKVSIWVD